jgi:cation:H+ antiporter
MSDSLMIWLQFFICASLIAYAGTKLAHYGDVIASKTGWSGSWVGLILLATVTSLPELSTGISSVALANAPNIAVGDVLGSCLFNLSILAIADVLYRPDSLYRNASQGHILSAGFGVVLIGFVGLGLLLGAKTRPFAVGHVGIFAVISALLYLLAVRAVFSYETTHLLNSGDKMIKRYDHLSLRQACLGYGVAASVVVGAGIWLPFIATRLADMMGWHKTFVGTLFVAVATSLPELAVTISALRMGALDMAIANVLGSNLFNILVLAIDDVFFLQGPILTQVSSIHAVTAFFAVIMSGIVIIGLLIRPIARPLRGMSWISIALFVVFFINFYVLYTYGD